MLVALSAQATFANCAASATYYNSEDDDSGVQLALALTCKSSEGPVCIYLGENEAVVAGASISTADLYRQDISKVGNQLKISMKSALGLDSFLDYKYVNVALNLRSLEGIVKYGGHGVSPYDGLVSHPEQSLPIECTKP